MTFSMNICGYVAQVHSRFDSTPAYFREYVTQDTPQFTIAPTDADLAFEQAFSIEEAITEGIRPRTYTGPYLERAAIRRAFAEFLFDRDVLLLHGSCVAQEQRAYLFTAKCGVGKSTHTRLWCQHLGGQMVNDDKPFLALTGQGVTAYGSPWNGKHGLSSNIAVPLAGICILERGPVDQIVPIAPAEAYPLLESQAYVPLDPGKAPRRLQLLQQLTEAVPLWRMACTPTKNAAITAHKAMSNIFI